MAKYKIVILTPDENGNFTFTKEELGDLLDKAYEEGLEEGKKWSITTPSTNPLPYVVPQPYITWTGSGTGDVPTKTTSVWMQCQGRGEDVLLTTGNVQTHENLQGSV